jgi:hypothetical protein
VCGNWSGRAPISRPDHGHRVGNASGTYRVAQTRHTRRSNVRHEPTAIPISQSRRFSCAEMIHSTTPDFRHKPLIGKAVKSFFKKNELLGIGNFDLETLIASRAIVGRYKAHRARRGPLSPWAIITSHSEVGARHVPLVEFSAIFRLPASPTRSVQLFLGKP